MDDDQLDEKTYSGKANFVAKVVEAADTVLGVFVVVVLHEAKAARSMSACRRALSTRVRLTLCKDRSSDR